MASVLQLDRVGFGIVVVLLVVLVSHKRWPGGCMLGDDGDSIGAVVVDYASSGVTVDSYAAEASYALVGAVAVVMQQTWLDWWTEQVAVLPWHADGESHLEACCRAHETVPTSHCHCACHC